MSCPELLIVYEWSHLLEKLQQFRRHPDWKSAFNKALSHFTVPAPNGGFGILEKDMAALLDAADQEFIDEIIRRSGRPSL